jgi:hypothetical protein
LAERPERTVTLENGLKVNVGKAGEMRVLNYPKSWKASLEVLQVPTAAVVSEITVASCEALSQRISGGGGASSPSSQRLFDEIRRTSPVLVRLDIFSQFQESHIAAALRRIYEENEWELPNAFLLANPIEASEWQIRIEPGAGSLSERVGNMGELQRLVTGLVTASTAQVGVSHAPITAIDFLCDLKMGKTAFTVTLVGDLAGTPLLRPLLPVGQAEKVSEHLQSYAERFPPLTDRVTFSKNRILASAIVSRYLVEHRVDLSLESVVTLVDRLSSSETGAPLALSAGEVEERIQILISDRSPFQGEANVVFEGGQS